MKTCFECKFHEEVGKNYKCNNDVRRMPIECLMRGVLTENKWVRGFLIASNEADRRNSQKRESILERLKKMMGNDG